MTARLPSVSVVVPAYNARGVIDRCLEALLRQTIPPGTAEVIVVDDGSTDDTPARVQAYPAVRLVTQDHAGPAAARNNGVQQAVGEVILFTDADCAPAPDWIERMASPFAPGSTASDGTVVSGVKGAYRTHQRELVARFVQAEYEEKYEHMAHQASIDFIDTYSAGYRRDTFLTNGGFDTSFPDASVEDQEFSFRLSKRGYRMIFLPEACVYHWGHPTNLWSYARRKFKIGYWKAFMHRRHPDKLVRDSHTPQSLRLQIALIGLTVALLLGAVVWPALGWGAAATGLGFLLSTIPFVARRWAMDRSVALAAPLLLLVRAAALGLGFVGGVLAQLVP
jgi:glycosyltransferase involved in cell wall biosynthesis